MLYLIGLGLDLNGISSYGLKIAKRCKKIYLENYTVDFPYSRKNLGEFVGKKIIYADRRFIESFELVDIASKTDICLLVYGSPLTATTHISLIEEAKKSGIKTKVIHAASVFDAVAETGLQIYKFGKITSLPKWDEEKNFMPMSFMETLRENKSIGAHSLILIDISLKFPEAFEQLKKSSKEHDFKIEKIILCQCLGTEQQKILYRDFSKVENYDPKLPYCIILPGKLNSKEKEFLENFK